MTQRLPELTFALSLFLTAFSIAQDEPVVKKETPVAAAEAVETLPPPRASANAVARLLNKRVPSVDWNDTTFEEILDWVRDQGDGQVNVVARWGPLGVEGASQESVVTLKLYNSTVAEILGEVMDVLSEDGEIRYHGIDNTLRISTKQDFERKMYVRVYDVTDLLFRVPNFGQSAPQIDLQQTTSSSGGGGGGGGQSVFSGGAGGGREQDDSGQQAEQRIEQELIKLRDSMFKVIAPESWEGEGGGRGRIEIVRGSLVVLNTIEVHEMIAGRFSFDD